MSELVAACPYPEDDKATHTYITLSSDPAMLDELEAAGAALEGNQQKRLGPEALAWLAPAGGTLDSPFSKISAKARFKAATTTRNLRTLIKVRDAAAGLPTAGVRSPGGRKALPAAAVRSAALKRPSRLTSTSTGSTTSSCATAATAAFNRFLALPPAHWPRRRQ